MDITVSKHDIKDQLSFRVYKLLDFHLEGSLPQSGAENPPNEDVVHQ